MSGLEILDLSENSLHGEAMLRNSCLASLRWLSLGENLSGEIPSFSVPKLRLLSLRGNRFQGQIPLQICQMEDLHILDLSNNLAGDLPPCLDNITSFTSKSHNDEVYPWIELYDEYLLLLLPLTLNGIIYLYDIRFIRRVGFKGMDVSSNRLTGTIPVQLTRLTGLSMLNMSHNLLTGQIPASFGDLTQVESLDLSHNKLFGALPSNLTSLHFLEVFSVSFNNLSGPTPIRVAQFATFDESSYFENSFLCGLPLPQECKQADKSSKENGTDKTETEGSNSHKISSSSSHTGSPIWLRLTILVYSFFKINKLG